jgi:hypothetical protein
MAFDDDFSGVEEEEVRQKPHEMVWPRLSAKKDTRRHVESRVK